MTRAQTVLVGVLVALVLLAHGLALIVPFQFDDEHQILHNPEMRELGSIPRFFLDPWIGSSLGYLKFYRPILFSSFAVDGTVGGGSPIPYRITSLLLLVLYALLVRQFSRVLLPRIVDGLARERVEATAVIAALLAVVHPMLNESILLASGRSSLLMAVFGLAALNLLASPRSRYKTLAVVGLTVLALLTKESAVVLGILAPLVVLVGASDKRLVKHLLAAWPVVVPVAVYVTVFFMFPRLNIDFPRFPEAPAVMPRSMMDPAPYADRLPQAALSLLGLSRLFVLPLGLSLVHEVATPVGWGRVLALLFWPTLGLVLVLLWRIGGWGRVVGFGVLWFSLALLPILLAGLNTPMAEHRVVLAMAGPLMAGAYCLSGIRSVPVRILTVGAIVVTLAAAAAAQSWPWRTAIDLWEHETGHSRASPRAWAFLAQSYEAAGDLDRAAEAISNAIEIRPDLPVILGKAAELELERGELAAAAAFASRALAGDPAFPELHLIIAEWLALGGDLEGALEHAHEATRLRPDSSPAWNAVGNILFLRGDPDAVAAYQKAVEMDPDNREAEINLQAARELFW